MPMFYHRQTESELMELARAALVRPRLEGPAIQYVAAKLDTPPPTREQAERRMRSLRACHLPSCTNGRAMRRRRISGPTCHPRRRGSTTT